MSKKNRQRRIANHIENNASKALAQPQVGIQPPPDFAFKNRERNRVAPAQDVWTKNGTVTYAPHHAEYIENEGNFVYYYDIGVPFENGIRLQFTGKNLPPSRCVAPVEAILAVDGVKRALMNDIRLAAGVLGRMSKYQKVMTGLGIVLLGKTFIKKTFERYLESFVDTSSIKVGRWFLEDAYYSKNVKEIRKGIEAFLGEIEINKDLAHKVSEVIGMLFEYDNAYRFRINDLLNEADSRKLESNFPKEVERLIDLLAERETIGNDSVPQRFKSGAKLLNYAWKVPKLRKGIKNAIKAINWEKVRLDFPDIYHTCLYSDYNTQGKTIQERMQILTAIHGPEVEGKWPPRIRITNG